MKKKIKKNIFLFILVLSIILSIISLNIMNKIVMPVFSSYISSILKNTATKTINDTIKEELDKNINYNDFMILSKNSNDEIQAIDFNSREINLILNDITNKVLEKVKSIELDYKKRNNIYEIPIGIISENIFLSNLGPFIPVNYKIIGNAISNINTSINEYGINNALIKISIITSITLEINVPFLNEKIDIKVENPFIMKVIQGSIPKYYGGGFSKNSNIFSVPIS